jgi:hypothetical protein
VGARGTPGKVSGPGRPELRPRLLMILLLAPLKVLKARSVYASRHHQEHVQALVGC